MPRQIQGAQRDFSFGEIDLALKRSDEHPARKAGLRQMSNARILNAAGVQNRPGRRALFPISNSCTRIEEFTISSGNTFKIGFGAGRVQIINSVGAIVANFTTQGGGAALPWTTNNLGTVVYTLIGLNVYLTFAGMKPQVITWDAVSTWTIADYAESVTAGGQKRTPFYRLSAKNITVLPSATAGAITVVFSSPIVVAGMVGTRIRYCGQQILLGSVIGTSSMNAQVIEPLPPAQTITLTSAVGTFNLGDAIVGLSSAAHGVITTTPTQQIISVSGVVGTFGLGDAVIGATSGATGTVIAIVSGGATLAQLTIALSTGTAFTAAETITGPTGSATASSVSGTSLTVQLLQVGGIVNVFAASEKIAGPSSSAVINTVATTTPKAVTVWDDEVMNAYRGYPASCFADQFRLGFCDFPAVPGGICWSAINDPNDLFIGANPSNAIFEITPDKVRVLYVLAGAESSEFVFCDGKLYYIKIDASTPLRPGSVGFQVLSSDGCAQVQPRALKEAIIYVNAGQNSVMAIIAVGNYYRPFNTRELTELHSHLFTTIIALAAPNADTTFNERYVYALNSNGSLVCGKYTITEGQIAAAIGWGPWSGGAALTWVSAWNSDVLFTSSYFNVPICEILDDTKYLDCALLVNSAPAAFAPPFGKGPLWFIPLQTVSLMDQSTRSMGTYVIDANGFIVPQFTGGENLLAATLVAGQPWTMTVEPFCPDAAPGADVGQRMSKRRVSRFAAYVVNSTGFLMARLFSGPITPTSPSLGTVMNFRRVPTWNQGDDPTLAPPLREEVQRSRPIGRSFDPRVAIIKDTPGPLQILELGMEASI